MASLIKTNPVLKIIRGSLVELPCPSIISWWWGFGSLLGLCLSIQLMTGIFLAIHYSNDVILAFFSVSHISRDVNYGFILRVCHTNGASIFFIMLYLHVGRGIYYESFYIVHTWIVGVILLLAVIATAFLGYVLPWGQISFWGATVITNLFSAIPIIGNNIVFWLWGGFSVENPTLTRFFTLHFLLPFVVVGLVIVHLLYLHQSGSFNPLGLSSNKDKITFHPYFSTKDLTGYRILLIVLVLLRFTYPWILGDPENFIQANPLVTPVHIQPEWYFLFAYAILRSIPNKLGGVIALAAAVLILIIMPFMPLTKFQGISYYPSRKFYFWGLVRIFLLLTWIGACPVEAPYVLIGQILSVIYFTYFFRHSYLKLAWDYII